nr:hypothetical protein [Candidatus Sigynarchaeota archaeon]
MATIPVEILFTILIIFFTILVHINNLARKQLLAFIIHTVVMGILTFYIGMQFSDPLKVLDFILIAIITVSVKGIMIPVIILKAFSKLKYEEEPKAFAISITRTVFTSVFLVILAYAIIWPVLAALPGGSLTPVTTVLLPASFGVVLMGFYMLATGKKIYTQIIALLVMENGIYFASIATTYGLSFLLEIGILFDTIAAVGIMAVFLFVIQRNLKTVQTKQMEELID